MPIRHAPQHCRHLDARRGLRAGVAAWLGLAALLLATSTAAAVIPIAGRHADESRSAPAAEASRQAASATSRPPAATATSRLPAATTSRPPAAAAALQRPSPVATPAAVRAP